MSKKFNIVHKIQNFRKSVGFKFISVIRFVEKKMISAKGLIDSEKKLMLMLLPSRRGEK